MKTPKMVITLPNGRQVGLGVYARAYRELITMDPAALVKGFDYFAAPAREILARVREGLMDRINRHDLSYRRGRKFDPDYQRSILQAARQLNQPRLIIDWLPPELRVRFTHRLRVNCA